MEQPGRVYARQELLQKTNTKDALAADSHVRDVQMTNLRSNFGTSARTTICAPCGAMATPCEAARQRTPPPSRLRLVSGSSTLRATWRCRNGGHTRSKSAQNITRGGSHVEGLWSWTNEGTCRHTSMPQPSSD
ncbi:hypothetical protein [Deinococcus ruber]|uniref:hypothetical protein n=1 Tax=Deinococcus ruber TaxID=1848197 RepID=UPI003570F412